MFYSEVLFVVVPEPSMTLQYQVSKLSPLAYCCTRKELDREVDGLVLSILVVVVDLLFGQSESLTMARCSSGATNREAFMANARTRN
jgi:hypothetical protein